MDSNSTLGSSMLKQFDWVEYSVFFTMLGLSLLIGVYFGFYKGGQNTVSDYLLGNKQMPLFPVTMSLISSQISGVTLLGVPSDVYRYGSQYSAVVITAFLAQGITIVIFLPVFYKLQLISLYQYLELRFNKKVRTLASLLFTISMMFFIPIVIYGPAIALNQVSGMNIYVITPLICGVCIIYTTFGGLRAVVWTDAIQGFAMLVSVIIVLILGIVKAGGIYTILEKSAEGDRLEFFNFDPDPTERMTFWTVTVGLTVSWISYTAISPAIVQRFISLPTYRQAQYSIYFLVLGALMFLVPSIFLGLVLYAVYRDCDPLSIKVVERPDQILPYFVLDVAENIRGFSGLFVVGVCSAALSTMSTGLNTIAGTFFEDFVQPCFRKPFSEKRASLIMKFLTLIAGVICVFLVIAVDKLGAILEMAYKFGGLTSGSTLGLFILGLLIPLTNSTGAFVGGIVSLGVMLWIMIGNQIATANGLIQYPTKPFSTLGCTMNMTQLPAVNETSALPDGEVWPLYKISVFYYSVVGSVTTIIVGIIVSYLTGPTKIEDINPDLLSPLVRTKKVKQVYSSVPLKEVP